MSKKYFVNTNTGTLHVFGLCSASTVKPYHVEYFDEENDAVKKFGKTLKICKICMKKREKVLEKRS